jgi:hypothetical protein
MVARGDGYRVVRLHCTQTFEVNRHVAALRHSRLDANGRARVGMRIDRRGLICMPAPGKDESDGDGDAENDCARSNPVFGVRRGF